MKIGIYFSESAIALAKEISSRLNADAIDPRQAELLSLKPTSQADLVVVIGGDGTLLKLVQEHPWVLGSVVVHVGAGRVNFLASVLARDLPSVSWLAEKILAGDYNVVELPTLNAGGLCTVVNDIVLRNVRFEKLLEVELYDAEEGLVAHGRADGVVVATPQGSTSYPLSAAGVLIDPRTRAKVVVPIAPYTLTLKPIVMPLDVPLGIRSTTPMSVTCDGMVKTIGVNEMVISRGSNVLKLATFGGFEFYERVRRRFRVL